MGVALPALGRLRFAPPESCRDGLAHPQPARQHRLEAIAYAATPGCQVLVAKDGVVVWEKGYGRLTYDATAGARDGHARSTTSPPSRKWPPRCKP